MLQDDRLRDDFGGLDVLALLPLCNNSTSIMNTKNSKEEIIFNDEFMLDSKSYGM